MQSKEGNMDSNGQGGGILGLLLGGVFGIIWLVCVVVLIIAMWKVFTKAGKPGWAALIPIYNIIVLLEIAGKPLWWIILFLIPLVNFIAWILVSIAVAEKFGKGTGFGLGLAFLPFIFLLVLGLGSAQYHRTTA